MLVEKEFITVQELIDELQKVKNKNEKVVISDNIFPTSLADSAFNFSNFEIKDGENPEDVFIINRNISLNGQAEEYINIIRHLYKDELNGTIYEL